MATAKIATPEQETIYQWIEDNYKKPVKERENLMIDAVAGSGKTSVLVKGSEYLPASTIMLSFSSAAARSLQSRLPTGKKASTFHSLCLGFIKERLSHKVRVDSMKTWKLLRKHITIDIGESGKDIVQLVELAKNLGVGILLEDEYYVWEEIVENYDIGNNDPEKLDTPDLIASARELLSKNFEDPKVIDFSDMLYLACEFILIRKMRPTKVQCLVVDEFQDTSPIQMEIMKHFGHNFIMVGDEAQTIYGFRGAGVDSMQTGREVFNPVQLPLTKTFRCAPRIVEEVAKFKPELESAFPEREGFVELRPNTHLVPSLGPDENDMVICRNNFPLVGVALYMMRHKLPFNMLGKFPEQLQMFVKSFKAENMSQFRNRLQEWWVKREAELKEKKRFGILQREEDKYNCLLELQKYSTSMEELQGKLEVMIRARRGPILTTIHGAKGLEAETVHFLYPSLLPSKFSITEDQLKQEDNLYYVGVTRAKTNLYYYEKEVA